MTDTTTNLNLPLATSGRFSLAASLKAGFKLIDTAIKALQDRKQIPAFTAADAGKVLTVSAGGAGLEWTAKS